MSLTVPCISAPGLPLATYSSGVLQDTETQYNLRKIHQCFGTRSNQSLGFHPMRKAQPQLLQHSLQWAHGQLQQAQQAEVKARPILASSVPVTGWETQESRLHLSWKDTSGTKRVLLWRTHFQGLSGKEMGQWAVDIPIIKLLNSPEIKGVRVGNSPS